MGSLNHSVYVALMTLLFWAGLTGAGLAQDEWLNKPFEQWSKADAQKLLTDSPWARTQEARLDFGSEVRRIAGAPTTSSGHQSLEMGGANIAVDYRVTLRLRSALPIRRALVRVKQIEAKYDQMSAKERAAFDEKMKGLLDCPACAQNYVVTLSCKSTNYPGADALYDGLRGATLPGLKPYVHLENDRGERRDLIHFVAPRAPGEETIFFFPRFDDEDRPLITPKTKKLYFRLSDNNAKAITNFELDVAKLLLNGELAF
ncbi:MAG: hypothetical protein V7641_232 [Blastocatellia bacterium]